MARNLKKRIDVLLCGPELSGFSGGIQTHIQNFLEAFQNHQIIHISFFPTTLGLYQNESWFSKIIRNLYNFFPFIKEIKKSDIVHLNSTFDSRSVTRDTYYAVLCIVLKKEIVLQFHGGSPGEIPALSNSIFKKTATFIFKRCKHILILSSRQQKEFGNVFPKIITILSKNYIDIDKYKKTKIDVKNPETVFLFMGRINKAKGIKQILKAAKILTSKEVSYKIHFCGKGPADEWLRKAIKEANLDKNVNFMGVVTGDLKQEILNGSDVMLLPTRHNEGLPYSILEAFCYEMPVISSYAGAIPDVIKDGKTGYLICHKDSEALAEKMLHFCRHPESVTQMGNQARKEAEQFYSFDNLRSFFSQIYH